MTNQSIVTANQTSALQVAGQAANQAARAGVFTDFRERKAANTLRAHDARLTTFTAFLGEVVGALPPGMLNQDAQAWQGITWGMVEAFKRWLLVEGYAIASVNQKLATVKSYARLAFKAGVIDVTEHALIRAVVGYSSKEAKHVNEHRDVTRLPGRNQKKAQHTSIPVSVAHALKRGHDDTAQGRRDALLMCLLFDLGLRCGEVAALTVGDVNLSEGTILVKRPKVDMTQTHNMPADLLKSMRAYFDNGDAPLANDALLLRSSNRLGGLEHGSMSTRSITKRVAYLGSKRGVTRLSAHDCRHFWATQVGAQVAKGKIDLFRLQEAGGWKSLAMPRRYVELAKIANEGIESV